MQGACAWLRKCVATHRALVLWVSGLVGVVLLANLVSDAIARAFAGPQILEGELYGLYLGQPHNDRIWAMFLASDHRCVLWASPDSSAPRAPIDPYFVGHWQLDSGMIFVAGGRASGQNSSPETFSLSWSSGEPTLGCHGPGMFYDALGDVDFYYAGASASARLRVSAASKHASGPTP